MFIDPDKGTKQKISFNTWEFGTPVELTDKIEKRIKRALAKAILSDDFLSFSSSVVEDYMRAVFTDTLRNTIGLGGPDLEPENCVTAHIIGADRIEIDLPFGVDDDNPTWSFTLRELVEDHLDDYRLPTKDRPLRSTRRKLTASGLWQRRATRHYRRWLRTANCNR